jgi:hypothetical protein
MEEDTLHRMEFFCGGLPVIRSLLPIRRLTELGVDVGYLGGAERRIFRLRESGAAVNVLR